MEDEFVDDSGRPPAIADDYAAAYSANTSVRISTPTPAGGEPPKLRLDIDVSDGLLSQRPQTPSWAPPSQTSKAASPT